MFDDPFAVESPSMLLGLVRTNNIREIHFSRNPKIFEFLQEYEFVKEFGEGANRMFREMEDAGLPDPEYRIVEFMLYATLKNQKWMKEQKRPQNAATSVQVTGQVDEFAVKKQQLIGRNHFNDTYLNLFWRKESSK